MKGIRKFAPKKYIECLELLAELTNLPRIGTKDNCTYPTMQANIAPAISRDDCESVSFIMSFFGCGIYLITAQDMSLEMGEFGQKAGHTDKKDDAGAESAMLSLTSLLQGKGYQYGQFHLLAFGVYIKLDPLRLMGFSSLHKHGGTPPLSPPGKPPADSAYRIMMVMYPLASMLSHSSSQRAGFASLPNNSIFTIAPEMSSVLYVFYYALMLNVILIYFSADVCNPIIPCNEATWLSDGPAMMDLEMLFNYSC
jgi:hypothetical protein